MRGLRSDLAASVLFPPATSHITSSAATEVRSVLLIHGKQATIKAGANPIRVALSTLSALSAAVSTTTSFPVEAGTRFDFVPENDSYVYAEAESGDGVKAWVWTSST